MCIIIITLIEIPVFEANSVVPGKSPRSVASDLGLPCLPMSHLWNARNKCVYVLKLHTRVG